MHAYRRQILLCPKIQKKLKEQIENSRDCTVFFTGDENFEMQEKEKNFVLNLEKRVCDCNEWNLTGISCRHVACSREMRRDIKSYVHEFYHLNKYKVTYGGITSNTKLLNMEENHISIYSPYD